MDKRKKRIFIIEVEIKQNCWDYKIGQKFLSVVISNNKTNALHSFTERHCGSEYPFYTITKIEDTWESGFFMPRIDSPNLL